MYTASRFQVTCDLGASAQWFPIYVLLVCPKSTFSLFPSTAKPFSSSETSDLNHPKNNTEGPSVKF